MRLYIQTMELFLGDRIMNSSRTFREHEWQFMKLKIPETVHAIKFVFC